MSKKPHPTGPLQWGPRLIAAGLRPVRLDPGRKFSSEKDWQKRSTKDALQIPLLFAPADNIGVLLGWSSNGTIDVDADSPEALQLLRWLPVTPCAWGRASIGMVHRLYDDPTLPDTRGDQEDYRAYDLRTTTHRSDGKTLELRWGSGLQTMGPGSRHPQAPHEQITTADGEVHKPAVAALDELKRICRLIAGTITLKRLWPDKGSRDTFAMYAAGGLLQIGVSPEDAADIITTAAEMAGDEAFRVRGNEAHSAAHKIAAGEKVAGWPKLEQAFGYVGLGDVMRYNLRSKGTPPPEDQQQEDKTTQRRPVGGGGGQDDRQQGRRERQRAAPAILLEHPWEPFPTDALPGSLCNLAVEAAPARNVDPSMIALPALVAAATLIGSTHRVTANGDWLEFPILWGAGICETGSRKSAGFDIAIEWLDEEQSRYYQQYQDAVRNDATALANWKDSPAESRGHKPATTAREVHLYTDDCTVEALPEMFFHNPRGLGYIAEEIQVLFTRLSQYSGSAGSNMGYFLKFYDGKSWNRKRASGDGVRWYNIRHACLSICGTIQPSIFASLLTEENISSGFLPRFLTIMPDPRRNYLQLDVGRLAALDGWHKTCAALYGLTHADGRPRVLKLSYAALDLYKPWHDHHADRLFDAVSGIVKATDAKRWGQCLRLALIDHLVTCLDRGHDPNGSIQVESVERAIRLAEWFSNEQARIYWYFLQRGTTATESLEERILRYFRKRPGVETATIRELQQALKDKSGTVTPDNIRAALTVLQQHGHGSVTFDGELAASFKVLLPGGSVGDGD